MLQVPHPFSSCLADRRSVPRFSGAALAIVSLAWLGLVGCGSAAPPKDTDTRATATVAATATPAVAESGCRKELYVVGNTNGLGVNLRKAPGGEVVTAYVEGTRLTICGEETVNAQQWYRVTGEDGTEGWILGTYILPASPTPGPSS